MAKVKINWPPMSMKAEGEDAAVLAQAEKFLEYVKEAHKISFDVLPTIFRDGCRDPEELDDEDDEDVEPLTEPEEVAPGAQWDVVAIYDNAGIPSIMHRFRRMNDKDLFRGGKDKPHPAFIIGGEVYDEIYISVYQNTMINGKPYSLPYMEPVTDITADKFADACFSKGEGWHCMTRIEWGLILRWCIANGFLPKGNTNFGKHPSENVYKAIPTYKDGDKGTGRTATGTGPLTWYHDNSPSGIADLCGNIWEWSGGVRMVYGELQILANNNGADSAHGQSATSAEWKAINAADGTLITPNGSGTTSGSVKADHISGKLVWSTNITVKKDESDYETEAQIECDSTIKDGAKLWLYNLGFLEYPGDTLEDSNGCWFNNGAAERCFYSGGNWNNSSCGLASFNGNNPRSYSWANLGFRSAFVKLPTA